MVCIDYVYTKIIIVALFSNDFGQKAVARCICCAVGLSRPSVPVTIISPLRPAMVMG